MDRELVMPLGCLEAFLERHSVPAWPEQVRNLIVRARDLAPGDPGYDLLVDDLRTLAETMSDLVIDGAAADAALHMLSDRLHQEVESARLTAR